MNSLRPFLLLTLSILILFTACTKEDLKPSPTPIVSFGGAITSMSKSTASNKKGCEQDSLFITPDFSQDSATSALLKSFQLSCPSEVCTTKLWNIVQLEVTFSEPLVTGSELEITLGTNVAPIFITVPAGSHQSILLQLPNDPKWRLQIIETGTVKLKDGQPLPSSLIVTGVGVLVLDDNLT